jgi:hypothetical protein
LVIGGPGVRRRTLSLVKSGTVPQRSHHDRTASAEVTLQNPTIRYAHVVASQQRICACVTPRVHNSACLCYVVPNDLKAMMIEHALDVTAGPGKIIIDAEFPLYVEADQIYNLACPASPIHYQHDPVQTTKTSVHGAINMLGLAVTPAGSRNLRYFWPCVRPAAPYSAALARHCSTLGMSAPLRRTGTSDAKLRQTSKRPAKIGRAAERLSAGITIDL